MSDVEIIFPKGREATIRRLRDMLKRAGYDVAAVEADGAGGASAGAKAVLILWDRSTIADASMRAAASAARRRGQAIDVSADGITPMDLDDDRALIHLSGWHGEPHHPGWRKILAQLD